MIKIPSHLQAHCQSPTSQRFNQSFVKELAKPAQRKIVFKKFPDPLRKIKNADTQANTDRQKSNMTMTRELNNDNGLQGQMKERQLVTGVCCQWRGSASYDSEVLIETVVLSRKFSGEVATEQQPPSRWLQAY
jgi:hypothetical protein